MPADVPIWPSGIARLADGILEVTTGDGVRVATGDILDVGIKPPKRGRLRLELKYRAGLDTVKTRYWVEEANQSDLERLVEAVRAAG